MYLDCAILFTLKKTLKIQNIRQELSVNELESRVTVGKTKILSESISDISQAIDFFSIIDLR